MFFNYDHRYGSYSEEMVNSGQVNFKIIPTPSEQQLQDSSFSITPRFYVKRVEVLRRITFSKWKKKWVLAYRFITLSVNERTTIASVLPICAAGNSCPIILFDNASLKEICCIYGLFNSLVFDYVARQKIGGTNFNFFIFYQLPVLPKSKFSQREFEYIIPKILELTYTAWDIKPFADDVWNEANETLRKVIQKQHAENTTATGGHNYEPPAWLEHDTQVKLAPFKWDENRRAILKAELDAYYVKLYGLTEEELRYILCPQDVYGENFPGETFRVLKEKEERKYGEYRTRRLVMEAWERLKEEP
jgi:hypothetical protein